jgi:hypothetical protein
MKLTFVAIAVAAVIAMPIAVQGEPAPSKAPSARRVCTVQSTLGTRLGNTRRCRTEEEREKEQQEGRQVAERIQAFRPTMCAPPRPTC